MCDDAVMGYLSDGRRVPFGVEPIVGYLFARESEATIIRIIMTGRMAGLDRSIIRQRLRRTYAEGGGADMASYRIAVLGDRESVLGFKALGLDVFPAESVEEARSTLHRLAKENYAVVYLTEQLAQYMTDDLGRYKDELTPAVILIPGKEGSLGIGMANVKKSVERAVGADIL